MKSSTALSIPTRGQYPGVEVLALESDSVGSFTDSTLSGFVTWGMPFTFDRPLLSGKRSQLIIVATSQVVQNLCKATMRSDWHSAWDMINLRSVTSCCQIATLTLPNCVFFPFQNVFLIAFHLEYVPKTQVTGRVSFLSLVNWKILKHLSTSPFPHLQNVELDQVISKIPVSPANFQ